MDVLATELTSDFSDRAIEGEVRLLIVSLEALSSLSRGGEFLMEEDLREAAAELSKDEVLHLRTMFIKLRDFGVNGLLESKELSPDKLYDAIPLVLAGYSAARPFCLDVPITLGAILNAVVARSKLNLALGHDQYGDANEYPWCFEGGNVEGLTVYELALLGGLSEAAVRNSVGAEATISFVRNLRAPVYLEPQDALDWLEGRREFKRTRDQGNREAADTLMVPQASDGSVFDPKACKRRQGYQIGAKGNERYVDAYEEALSELRSMSTPRWRRPAKGTGRFGIVNGVSWVSRSMNDLGL